nr:MAG: hypothetical protein [Microviridae sp.]
MEININLNTLEIMNTVQIIAVVVAGLYEVLSRVIPTNKTWSLIGLIINALKSLSDSLDRKK